MERTLSIIKPDGVRRGLIGEVIRLSAMVIGFFIAFLYYHDVASLPPIKSLPLQINIKQALAFVVIYLLCALAIITAGWFLKKLVHFTMLGWLDHLVGALIGLLKVMLIAYVICLSISSLPIRRIKRDFNNSLVYRSFRALPKGLSLVAIKSRTSVSKRWKCSLPGCKARCPPVPIISKRCGWPASAVLMWIDPSAPLSHSTMTWIVSSVSIEWTRLRVQAETRLGIPKK